MSFLILGVYWACGRRHRGRTLLAQICSVIYFAFFLLMPIWTSMEKTKPVPERVTMRRRYRRLGFPGGAGPDRPADLRAAEGGGGAVAPASSWTTWSRTFATRRHCSTAPACT